MAKGTMKIALIDLRSIGLYASTDRDFFVKSVSNTAGYIAGDYMSRQKVDELLSLGAYDITIAAVSNADITKYSITT